MEFIVTFSLCLRPEVILCTAIPKSLSNEADVTLILYNLKARRWACGLRGNQKSGGPSVRWDDSNVAWERISSGEYTHRLKVEPADRNSTLSGKVLMFREREQSRASNTKMGPLFHCFFENGGVASELRQIRRDSALNTKKVDIFFFF
jgi:hypothetical protein